MPQVYYKVDEGWGVLWNPRIGFQLGRYDESRGYWIAADTTVYPTLADAIQELRYRGVRTRSVEGETDSILVRKKTNFAVEWARESDNTAALRIYWDDVKVGTVWVSCVHRDRDGTRLYEVQTNMGFFETDVDPSDLQVVVVEALKAVIDHFVHNILPKSGLDDDLQAGVRSAAYNSRTAMIANALYAWQYRI